MASIGSVVNAVGNVANILFDLSPKTFYSTRDFYNFIKKRQNAPMARKHFTIVPRCQIHTLGNGIPQIWDSLFKDGNLAKFAILAQQLKFPGASFGIQGGSAQQITTPYGQYSPQANGYSGGNGNTITIDFLQTADPVIEHMILPWYYECMRTSNEERPLNRSDFQKLKDGISDGILDGMATGLTKAADYIGAGKDSWLRSGSKYFTDKKGNYSNRNISEYPCPKLTLDVKYYRMDQIAGLQFLMNPTFVYRITGVYPISITPAEAVHSGYDYNKLTRSVTFKYNNFICIPDGSYQQQMYGNVRRGFPYKNMSPIQILNALNQTAQGVMGAVNSIRNI